MIPNGPKYVELIKKLKQVEILHPKTTRLKIPAERLISLIPPAFVINKRYIRNVENYIISMIVPPLASAVEFSNNDIFEALSDCLIYCIDNNIQINHNQKIDGFWKFDQNQSRNSRSNKGYLI